jgi:hypothetical protein
MNPLVQLKKTTPLFLIALACFGLSSTVRAADETRFNANTGEGDGALQSIATGTNNTAVGSGALFSLTTGKQNTATGAQALKNNTADQNTANGFQTLVSNTTGSFNAATGWRALFKNTIGEENTADGFQALYHNTTGIQNTANGESALVSNITGSGNSANGVAALESNTTGSGNTAVGGFALSFNTTGGNNIAIGNAAGNNVTTADNVICIGSDVGGANVEQSCFIGNIRGITTGSADAIPVLIDGFGQLGTASSSRRFKKEIKPMDEASEAILALNPVTFHYKSDNTNTPQFGLIAEEVAEVNPDLVVRDKDGEIYTVRYDAVNAMLLNEFLKEHRKVEEQNRKSEQQEMTITQLKKEMGSVVARLKEQAAQIQKVSDQLEVNKAAPQIVLNNQ